MQAGQADGCYKNQHACRQEASFDASLACLLAIISLKAVDIKLPFAPEVMGAYLSLHNVCAAEGYIPEIEEEEVKKEGSRQDNRADNGDEDDVDERVLTWKWFA